jgi:hypothetical protein
MVWLYEKNVYGKDTEKDITITISMKEIYGTVQKKTVWPGTGEHPNRRKRQQ